MKLYVLDRFSEDYGVLVSTDKSLKIPADKLLCGAAEGSVLKLISSSFILDNEEHLRRASKARSFIDKLKNR